MDNEKQSGEIANSLSSCLLLILLAFVPAVFVLAGLLALFNGYLLPGLFALGFGGLALLPALHAWATLSLSYERKDKKTKEK